LFLILARPPALRRPGALPLLFIIGGLATLTLPACGRSTPSSPQIRLSHADANPSAATIEITGLPSDELNALRARTHTVAEWQAVVRVTVVATQPATSTPAAVPAVAGAYAVTDRGIVFTPMFGLDPGQPYAVTVNHRGGQLTEVVSLPKPSVAPTTVVSHTYPSADTVPENQLRLYVHFSAPMGRKGGLDYIRLLDSSGQEMKGAFLPLDAEFWNGDRTRFTLFFDPGRVKRGVRPNEELGRALMAGQRYTLVVSRDWPDAQGLPLKEEFRRTFTAGSADTQPLDPKTWQVQPPAGGTREPLTVTFPEPLDHGLLVRALGVSTASGAVNGESAVDSQEKRWAFTPRDPWSGGDYRIVVMTILEDLAGNRIGRAFEVDRFDRVDAQSGGETIDLPFRAR
jgi:hypothetical protein